MIITGAILLIKFITGKATMIKPCFSEIVGQ